MERLQNVCECMCSEWNARISISKTRTVSKVQLYSFRCLLKSKEQMAGLSRDLPNSGCIWGLTSLDKEQV